ncbi:MAG: restriction endonuclease subunit R, partial [Eggerthellaceae bacterium]|nr:restriction endonuclease subunit R [Eggerthellaceae bacterium]
GYFSIDKKGRVVDSKINSRTSESDDESAYDLILRNKERLLSFNEPTRFIFSHSALREGWDNPNIFQICTLKHSDNETSKRQEVGRGLRLCVDATGERQDAGLLGDRGVHEVNVLTVIASESYHQFTESLQSDIREGLHDRPRAVSENFFTDKHVTVQEGSELVTFTKEESRRAYGWLIQSGYVDFDGVPTEKFKEEGFDEVAIERLPEELKPKAGGIELLVRSVYDPSVLDGMIGNGHERKVSVNKLNHNFERKAFQELWNSINTKHAYTVDFDSQELIDKAVASINADLVVSELAYAMTVGAQENQIERESIESANQFSVKRTSHEKIATGKVRVTYDLLGEIAQKATMTRRSVAAILSKIAPNKFALFEKNPEEFIAKVAKLIVSQKANMIVDHIEYHPIDGKYDSAIFTESMPQNASKAMPVSKGIQDYVIPDSDIEANFAHDLDTAEDVEVYAKLPRSFTIPTPVGNYAPDWAIAFKDSEKVQHVYFVAETKGTLESLELRGVEDAKIKCAKKLFNEASTANVRYHQVTAYSDLLALVTN